MQQNLKTLEEFIKNYETSWDDQKDPSMARMVRMDGEKFRVLLAYMTKGQYEDAGKSVYHMDTYPREMILNEIDRIFPEEIASVVSKGAGY